MTGQALFPRVLLGLVIAASAIWLALNRDWLDPALIERSLRDLGLLAPLGHVALFALGTVLFVPGTIFALAGGALFGPFWGAVLNLAGGTLGASGAFLASRYIGADWIRRRAGARLERLVAGVEAEGWRFVAFVRLVPLFPFNLANYAFGMTRIPLTHYVFASAVFMAPGTLAYTWLGYAGREALAGRAEAIWYGLLGLGLLAAIAFVPSLRRRLEAAPALMQTRDLKRRLDEAERLIVIDVRGPDEFAGPLGHIPGARNLPVEQLPLRLVELAGFKQAKLVLVCRTDRRSAKAASLLFANGFADVSVLQGGMEQWNREDFAVEHRVQTNGK
jgi:uncharacterized membrane protein YdjX (TVP38/TMEM64 family)/rhodanese-related sulfurtransferase